MNNWERSMMIGEILLSDTLNTFDRYEVSSELALFLIDRVRAQVVDALYKKSLKSILELETELEQHRVAKETGNVTDE